jgi:hypothetical protein
VEANRPEKRLGVVARDSKERFAGEEGWYVDGCSGDSEDGRMRLVV